MPIIVYKKFVRVVKLESFWLKALTIGLQTKEQEKGEQKRQVPYHMHINLDLVEFVHLCTAMLLEVPNTARDKDSKRRVISKYFIKVMEYYDRQVFTGPPENTKESILVAAKALERGDWRSCQNLIINLPILSLIPAHEEIKKNASKGNTRARTENLSLLLWSIL